MARPKKKIEGLGDVVESITSFLGIKKCDACEQRRIALNNMFSFIKETRRKLTHDEIILINTINETKKVDDINVFFNMYNEIYGTHIKACNCPGVIMTLMEKLTVTAEHDKLGYDIDDANKPE